MRILLETVENDEPCFRVCGNRRPLLTAVRECNESHSGSVVYALMYFSVEHNYLVPHYLIQVANEKPYYDTVLSFAY